ncbi:hypothetical protein KC332_g14191 [Hortaea werneckii]|uniref:FAM50A/XAP5 C-terminal domain-containing protein n=1 Tax=Hortaea werneckii TaxID=91943 RepID=A0A3M7I1T0_HORWE|nr:hypothetical protein KC358_g14190 [Hortaea werneckii]KAI6806854.1 hypothetical protein KC350_g13981 [Hortaea werneckii]KAI6907651.1 hypothetical protein KC348_g14152 [Hortaea werneckii]KAI6924523.1 hypothetical protein KC341_g13994 [Hortaea werneckii]KAI6953724.1 hypothetical protein KC321_g16786 [Hortaea werneckii]
MADSSSSKPPSGSSTPNPARFQSQGHTAEDLLKEQTYGLVTLSDFRKRRAEAVEQSERSQDGTPAPGEPDGREPAAKAVFKKRKKGVKKGGLSFANDDEEGEESTASTPAQVSRAITPKEGSAAPTDPEDATDVCVPTVKKRLKPNAAISNAPKAMTKSVMQKESQLKDQLRKEYLQIQEAVKATEFMLPFTFYHGKSLPGGMVRMKKGDHIWLFLERARKVGADMAGRGDRSKKDWARISVDDLIVVTGDLIIPHHYDIHYFLLNRCIGYNKLPLFPYTADPTPATPSHLLPTSSSNTTSTTTPDPQPPSEAPQLPTGLSTATSRAQARATSQAQQIPDSELEGYDHDPSRTKVVDRRWYEQNKHIYPASLWEEFDPEKDYTEGVRTDGKGNAMFFENR